MSRSITPAPSGSLSPDFITVPSSTGFSAGDYVYQKDGGFGIPASSGAANFNVSPASPILAAGTGGTAALVNWRGYASPAQGGSTGQCAAKLSDGNIVIGYFNPSTSYAYFRIVDTNNTTVVAETLVSSSIAPSGSNGPVGVIALTGGGFVVHYPSGTNKPAYGVYTNAGAVTTAFANDTTYPTTILAGKAINGCALPNGGFALAVGGNAVLNAYFRSYDSTGVGVYAWTSGGATVVNGAYVSIAARSDSSICVAWVSTSVLALYAVYNAAGGALATGNFTLQNTVYQMNVACLSNNTFVIGYMFDASTYTPRFRFLPTGNVLGSETTPPTTNVNTTTGYSGTSSSILIFPLSSGGFVYFMGDGLGTFYYLFYTSAGVLVYSAPRVCPPLIITGTGGGFGPIYAGITEITGYLSIYHSGYMYNSSTQLYELYNTKISLTDYNLLGSVTTTASVGTVSASAGAYARSTSLPTKASYVAANTEVLNLNQVMSTANLYTATPNAVYSGTIDSLHSTTLPDGRFGIVYKDASTAAVYFNIYSIVGVLQTTVFVGTSLTNYQIRVRITTLSSGKIAVAFLTTTNALTIYVYSSSFSFIGSTTIAVGTNTYYDITGVLNDRIAAVYGAITTNTVSFQMFSNAPASIQAGQTLAAHTSPQLMTAQSTSTGGFWAQWMTSGNGPNAMLIYTNAAGTTYTKGTLLGYGSSTVNTASVSPLGVSAINTAIALSASSGTQLQNSQFSPQGNGTPVTSSAPSTFTTTNFSSNVSNCAFGVTGAGTFVYLGSGNASGNLYGFVNVGSLATAAATPLGNLSGITIANTANGGMQACITSSYGYNAVITWVNSANIGTFAIVNAYPFNATQAITAGVTGSAPTTPLNISQSSGYYLAGVAVSDCPAGGTGQIQTNGVANLNSQYSTTTAFQGFDFQNPVTVGVKGTAVGRTVTMIKD